MKTKFETLVEEILEKPKTFDNLDVKILKLKEHSKKQGYNFWDISVNGTEGTFIERLNTSRPEGYVRDWPDYFLEPSYDVYTGKSQMAVPYRLGQDKRLRAKIETQILNAIEEYKNS